MYKYVFAVLVVLVAAASACSPLPWKEATPSTVLGPNDLTPADRAFHESKMQELINLSQMYMSQGIPQAIFTSSIVAKNGTTMCMSRNTGEKASVRHGEMQALLNCSEIYNKGYWGPNKDTDEEYTMYTTGESCPMCQAAAMWSGISKIVFGTSVKTLYCDLCMGQILVESNFINAYGYGNSKSATYNAPVLIGGILANVTDTQVFSSYCEGSNNTKVWTVNPICNKDYKPGCNTNSSSIVGANMLFVVSVIIGAIAMLF